MEKKYLLCTAMMLMGGVLNTSAQNGNYEYNIPKIASILEKASSVGEFSEGFLNVVIDGNWGYIDFRGEVIAPFEYSYAKPFSCGMARVEKTNQNQYGFVNVRGEFITNEYLKGAQDFYDGLAVTFNGEYGVVNKQGRLVVPYQPNIIYDYKDGMARVLVDRRKYGAYNINGQLAVPAIYSGMRDFSCGFACAQIGSEHFYIRKNGTRLQPSALRGGEDFKDNIAIINEGSCFMDSYGNITDFYSLSEFGESYCEFEDFSEGLAVVTSCEPEGPTKKGYMNKLGKIIVPIEYDEAYAFKNGMAKVAKDGQYGFINKDGRLIVNYIYDDATDFSDGFGIVKQNDKYGYINKQGNLIGPIIFDEAQPFAFGIAKVKLNDKIGFIDKHGQCTLKIDNSDK